MNVVILTGNLVRDPEVRYGQNQNQIANFTIAVNRPPRQGEESSADFIRVTCFGKQAELVERYLSKGRKVGVEGRIQTGSYEKDGKRNYTTDIIANRVEFLDSKGSSSGGGSGWSGGGESSSLDEGQFSGPGSDSGNKGTASGGLPSGISEFEDDDEDDLPF